jgi:hypothetical protein
MKLATLTGSNNEQHKFVTTDHAASVIVITNNTKMQLSSLMMG